MYPISAQIDHELEQFMLELIRSRSIKSILEIGTLYGYSAGQFFHAMAGGHIVTIERDSENYKIALNKLQGNSKIKLIHADAVEYLPQIDQKFELIFIDANKSKYPFYLQQSLRLLCPQGVIVADNTNFKGMVLNDQPAIKPYKAIINGLRQFHEIANKLPGFNVSQYGDFTVLKQL